MSGERMLAALSVAATAAAAVAVEEATGALAMRMAAVPGVVAEPGAGVVRLRGQGLLARVFGGRSRDADPRVAAAVWGERA